MPLNEQVEYVEGIYLSHFGDEYKIWTDEIPEGLVLVYHDETKKWELSTPFTKEQSAYELKVYRKQGVYHDWECLVRTLANWKSKDVPVVQLFAVLKWLRKVNDAIFLDKEETLGEV